MIEDSCPTILSVINDACYAGDIDRVRGLLDGGGVGVNDTDDSEYGAGRGMGETMLGSAARGGHLAIVNMLIEAGAAVNQAIVGYHQDHSSPLFIACDGGHAKVVTALIEAGARVDDINGYRSPLLHACEHGGNLEVVKALIKGNASVDQPGDSEDQTPLEAASRDGNLEIVEALIEAEVTVDAADESGCTALEAAITSHRRGEVSGHLEVVKALIKANAKVDQANVCGQTPIFIAAKRGLAPFVQVLLDAGARPWMPCVNTRSEVRRSQSPLHVATHYGHLDCVKLLIGFRPNSPGWTAFLVGSRPRPDLDEGAHLPPPAERPSLQQQLLRRVHRSNEQQALRLIWAFQRERHSNLYLVSDLAPGYYLAEPEKSSGGRYVPPDRATALEIAEQNVEDLRRIRSGGQAAAAGRALAHAEYLVRAERRRDLQWCAGHHALTQAEYLERATELAFEACVEVAKLLRSKMGLSKEGEAVGEKKTATKGGKK